MTSLLSLIRRNWTALHPVEVAKSRDALRIGLLGASRIAFVDGPMAVIIPAKSHPEVIVAAMAARDHKKAEVYAKKWGIPIVHISYQDLIDDPSIDAIYIPLPNGLHYEWALKSLQAGKHVLLEKPSVSNSLEAQSLFSHPLLTQPKAPTLLEAFHPLFHPAIQLFLSLLSPPDIESATSSFTLPAYIFPRDDIRFNYDVGGGTLMDLTYMALFLRLIFAAEPEECLHAQARLMPEPYDTRCDQAMAARWRFPNGGVGELYADLAGKGYGVWGSGWVPRITIPMARAVHREMVIPEQGMGVGEGEEHVSVRSVTVWNMLGPVLWHRIDIVSSHCVRRVDTKAVRRKWEEREFRKAYTWADGDSKKGDETWSTYRYQLEAFVDCVKGREGSGIWMTGEDSVAQMEMIDQAYEKAGLLLRPTSAFLESGGG